MLSFAEMIVLNSVCNKNSVEYGFNFTREEKKICTCIFHAWLP